MIDRRRLMLSSAGLGLMAALPAVAQTPAMSPADARLDAMLTRWFEENVDLSPEYATNLGLDRGERTGRGFAQHPARKDRADHALVHVWRISLQPAIGKEARQLGRGARAAR